jgi:aminoglycoside N3'-acetyltransferase
MPYAYWMRYVFDPKPSKYTVTMDQLERIVRSLGGVVMSDVPEEAWTPEYRAAIDRAADRIAKIIDDDTIAAWAGRR